MPTVDIGQQLSKAGFEELPVAPRRLIVAVEGLDKSGKNHFAFTFPDPIVVVDFDKGMEGMVEKFTRKGKVIRRSTSKSLSVPKFASKEKYMEIWEAARVSFMAAVESPLVKTIVVDKAGDMWDLLQLQTWGRVERVPPLERVGVNKVYKGLIRAVFETDKNLVMLHGLKKHYENKTVKKKDGSESEVGEWDGTYDRAGHADSAYLVQGNFRSHYRNGHFYLELLNSRHNMKLAGYEWEDDEINFDSVYDALMEE